MAVEVLKWAGVGFFIAVLGIFIVGGIYSIVDEIKSERQFRKIKKNPKTLTDYPYLPLSMETKHFGWSYEYDRYHGWNYFIWYIRDDGHKGIINYFEECSRTRAIEECRKLEEQFYGCGG